MDRYEEGVWVSGFVTWCKKCGCLSSSIDGGAGDTWFQLWLVTISGVQSWFQSFYRNENYIIRGRGKISVKCCDFGHRDFPGHVYDWLYCCVLVDEERWIVQLGQPKVLCLSRVVERIHWELTTEMIFQQVEVGWQIGWKIVLKTRLKTRVDRPSDIA